MKLKGFYNMTNKKKGLGIIFDHERFDFDRSSEVERKGTAHDRKALKATLESFGFEVKAHVDLKKSDITKRLKEVAKKEHADYDCVVVAVLTHGDESNLYARDSKYPSEMLLGCFAEGHCEAMAGKPKIFIIQVNKPLIISLLN